MAFRSETSGQAGGRTAPGLGRTAPCKLLNSGTQFCPDIRGSLPLGPLRPSCRTRDPCAQVCSAFFPSFYNGASLRRGGLWTSALCARGSNSDVFMTRINRRTDATCSEIFGMRLDSKGTFLNRRGSIGEAAEQSHPVLDLDPAEAISSG